MSKIEVGSEWKSLVDEPWMAGVYFGEQVIVMDVDTKIGEVTFKGNRNILWSGSLENWRKYFAPAEEISLATLARDFYRDAGGASNTSDNVNSPSHYGQGKIEAIEYIKDFLTPEEYQGYLRGNIAKYLHRFPYKNGIEDLKKAQWYLGRLIQEVE